MCRFRCSYLWWCHCFLSQLFNVLTGILGQMFIRNMNKVSRLSVGCVKSYSMITLGVNCALATNQSVYCHNTTLLYCWSKFCKGCETGDSICLYSVSECTRKLPMFYYHAEQCSYGYSNWTPPLVQWWVIMSVSCIKPSAPTNQCSQVTCNNPQWPIRPHCMSHGLNGPMRSWYVRVISFHNPLWSIAETTGQNVMRVVSNRDNTPTVLVLMSLH